MDILIKSFNRPYYLDRCIQSIYKYVEGEFKIVILDDGTPAQYLEKINSLYPELIILKSALYIQKTAAISRHVRGQEKFDLFSIPTDLWRQQVSDGSDVFLMMEDDNWFTAPVNLHEIRTEMEKNNFLMLALSWQGNKKFVRGRKQKISAHIEEIKPDIPVLDRMIFLNKYNIRSVLSILDKIKVSSILYRMKVLKNEYELRWPFYTLYIITSTFFDKKYWLYLWEGSPQKVDELYQLKRAAELFWEKKGAYAKSVEEITRTSYSSSATGSFKDIYFDVFHFNHHINNAWLQGEFDAMNNFPRDYDPAYVRKFLDKAGDKKSSYDNWMLWATRFKSQFRNIGCAVDWKT